MIHWKALNTAGKISAIAGIYEPGMSASYIAANFEGATRNAVIGLYHRHADKLVQWPLLPHGKGSHPEGRRKPEGKGTTFKRSGLTGLFTGLRNVQTPATPKPLPEPRKVFHEAKLCGKPMIMLQANECRWPVNNAAGDELHLFCALPSEGVYCCHHKARSFMPPRAKAGAEQ